MAVRIAGADRPALSVDLYTGESLFPNCPARPRPAPFYP